MDIFVEQIIKKRFGTKDYAVIILVLLLGCLLIGVTVALIPLLAVLVVIGVCFGAYYVITSRSMEFEYSVTNGDVTIDRIIYRRKRKRVISVDAHTVDAIGKYKPEDHRGKDYSSRIFASVRDDGIGEDSWYFTARHPKQGNVLVVFNPEEKVLNAIKPFLPRQVAHNAFGRN
jgi:hypothetical protein